MTSTHRTLAALLLTAAVITPPASPVDTARIAIADEADLPGSFAEQVVTIDGREFRVRVILNFGYIGIPPEGPDVDPIAYRNVTVQVFSVDGRPIGRMATPVVTVRGPGGPYSGTIPRVRAAGELAPTRRYSTNISTPLDVSEDFRVSVQIRTPRGSATARFTEVTFASPLSLP
jgi:hypothetical protein